MTKSAPDFAIADLNDVVAATVRLARSELVVREVQVETRLPRGALPVRGNKAQLQQVLLNLLLNAADAMAYLEPEIRHMTVETRFRPDGWRELAVHDNGPGVTPELSERAFRPFTSTKRNGLGLGLSICQTIAQAHGGTLAFDEAARKGARAVLALPPP
jgi:C4-dicarboxylate-specific signal transduction histidine kinase